MIDLTPLDVRKKRGDFTKSLRGYDPAEVDQFLEDVAARMEELVKENVRMRDRMELLESQVSASEGREKAVHEALVTAQELRADVRDQAQKESDLILRDARGRINQMVHEAEKTLQNRQLALDELERQRLRFLKSFRTLLERELDAVEVEEGRAPLEDLTVELNLGGDWTPGAAEVEDSGQSDSEGDVEAEQEGEREVPDGEAEAVTASEADTAEDPTEEDGAAEEGETRSLWLYDLEEGDDGKRGYSD